MWILDSRNRGRWRN